MSFNPWSIIILLIIVTGNAGRYGKHLQDKGEVLEELIQIS